MLTYLGQWILKNSEELSRYEEKWLKAEKDIWTGYNEPPSDVFSVVSDLSLRQHQMLPLNSDKRSAGQKPIQSKLTTFPVLADS